MVRNRKHIVVAVTVSVFLSVVLAVVLTLTLKGKSTVKKDDSPKATVDANRTAAASLKGSQEDVKTVDEDDFTAIDRKVTHRDAILDGKIIPVKSDFLTYFDETIAYFLGVRAEAQGTTPGPYVSKLFGTDAHKVADLIIKQIPELQKIRAGFYMIELPKQDIEEVEKLEPAKLEEALKELPFKVASVLRKLHDYKVGHDDLVANIKGILVSSGQGKRGLGSMSDGLAASCGSVTASLEEILDIVIRHWNTHDPQFGENFRQVLDWLLLFRTEDGMIKLRRWIVLFGDWLTGYVQTHPNDPLVEKFRSHVIRWTAKSIINSRTRPQSPYHTEPIPPSQTEYLKTQRIENFVIGMFSDFATLLRCVAYVLNVDALASEVKLQRYEDFIPTAVDIMGGFLDEFVSPRPGTTASEEEILRQLITFVYKQYGMTIQETEYAGKMNEAKQLKRHMHVLSQNLNFLRPFFLQYMKEIFA